MSLGIDAQKAMLLEKSEPPHSPCEVCVIEKHHRTSSRVINRIDLYKRATKKKELSQDDLAESGKIAHTLGGSCIVYGLTYDWTDLTEIHLLRKKSEVSSRLKKYAAKRKAKCKPMQRFKSDNGREFDLTACKK